MVTGDDELRRSIDTLKVTMDQLIAQLVRRDVYDSDQRGITAQIKVVSDDIDRVEKRQDKIEENAAANKRLIIAAFVSPIVLLVVQLYLRSQGVA